MPTMVEIRGAVVRALQIGGASYHPTDGSRDDIVHSLAGENDRLCLSWYQWLNGIQSVAVVELVFRSNQMIQSVRTRPRQAALLRERAVNHLFDPEH